jgi:integrase
MISRLRPHEILNLKMKDIIFKAAEDGIQYAEVLITGGKTKPRTLPLIDSIPYLKDWTLDHPAAVCIEFHYRQAYRKQFSKTRLVYQIKEFFLNHNNLQFIISVFY